MTFRVEHVHEAYNEPYYERSICRKLERWTADGWEVVSVSMVKDTPQPYYGGECDKTYIVTLRKP